MKLLLDRRFVLATGICAAIMMIAAVGRGTLQTATDATPHASGAVDLAAFDAEAKVIDLDAPALGNGRKDTNFSGVAYNPATRTLIVVDNEPNAGDAAGKPDQGDLYEYDLDGKLIRHIDLVGFSDPEGIAYMGADPKQTDRDLYVIAEERIGTLAVVSVPRGKDGVRLVRGESGAVIEPKPNPIDDKNDLANDGLEGVAYDAETDVFYVVKESGPTRGVYRVARGGRCEPVAIAGLFDGVPGKSEPLEDLADVQFHGGHLLVLSEISNRVLAVRVKSGEDEVAGEIVGQFPRLGETLPHKQPEGIAISDDGQTLWIVGEPREFARYGKKRTTP